MKNIDPIRNVENIKELYQPCVKSVEGIVKYYITIIDTNEEQEVTKEIFLQFLEWERDYENLVRNKRRRKANGHDVLSLDKQYENEVTIQDFLASNDVPVEKTVVTNIFLENIYRFAIENCNDLELQMFFNVFLDGMTMECFSRLCGIPRTTLNYRKEKLQKKFQKNFQKF